MGGLFYTLGRSVGYATIPAIRKSKWVWQSLTGNEAESLQSELEFGRALAAELRLKTGVSHDPSDTALIQGIVKQLSTCVRNKLRTFKGEVQLDTAPTALALPGGFIFVSTGLLDFCSRNPDEIAFVIGHEMGHIVRGHALQRMLGRIGAEGLSSVLSRGLLNPALRETGLKWLESSHSTDAEQEADEFGIRVLTAAGFHPKGAFQLFTRLALLREQGQLTASYFVSHPPESERTAQLKAVLSSINSALGSSRAGTGSTPSAPASP